MSAKPVMPDEWTVTIEASGELRAQPVDPAAVQSILGRLAEHTAAVSHRPRQFSTRLTVWEHDALAAASEATRVWRDAARSCSLPDWPITRLDVTRAG